MLARLPAPPFRSSSTFDRESSIAGRRLRASRTSVKLDRRSAMSHDILSDVLRNVRLRGAPYYYVCGSSSWVAEAPAARDIAAAVMPDSEHVMEYHVLMRGMCWGAIVGEPPVRIATGDIVLFPHGDAHVMSSAPGMRAPADRVELCRAQAGAAALHLASRCGREARGDRSR